MTETQDPTPQRRGDDDRDRPARPDEPTMADVEHTHPITGESFQTAYYRGPLVSDGGGDGGQRPAEVPNPSPRAGAEGEEGGEADDEPTADAEADGDAETGDTGLDEEMRDVDHTPPDDEEGANRVWERGAESRDEHR